MDHNATTECVSEGREPLMTPQRNSITDLLNEVIEERKASVSYTEAETDTAVARLYERFAQVRAESALRRGVEAAVATLPPARRSGWLTGAQAALRVVLGEVRRSSQILTDAARDLLPLTPDAWNFGAGAMAATRGEAANARRAESETAPGLPPLNIVLDDAADQRRVIATISDFPADRPPPVLLIVPDAPTDAAAPAIEIDPEIIVGPARGAATPARRLRYEATLPAGAYSIFIGNARAPDGSASPQG
jgi:hypothetical protein